MVQMKVRNIFPRKTNKKLLANCAWQKYNMAFSIPPAGIQAFKTLKYDL